MQTVHLEWEPDELLAAVAKGDKDAATVFVKRFQRRVYGLALAILSDRQLAEDAAQEVFVKIWKGAASYESRRGSVETWLLTITRNVSIDHLRKRRSIPIEPDRLLRMVVEAAEPSDVLVLNNLDASRIRREMLDLPDDQRRALVLAAYFGRSASEIAASEGIPLGTAKTRIRTAMLKLRSRFSQEFDS